jgi:hypothetical protein
MIHPADVTKLLDASFIMVKKITFMDEDYSLPAKVWMADTGSPFSQDLWNFLAANDLLTYSAENNDCDDFARSAMEVAAIAHRRMKTGTALAFGMMWYQPDWAKTGDCHCINIAIVGTHDAPEIVFYEPQQRQIVELTDFEKTEIIEIII